MAAELEHLEVVADPLFFECLRESHDDEQEENGRYAVALFDANVEGDRGVDCTQDQPYHAILVHFCDCRAESGWAPIIFEEDIHEPMVGGIKGFHKVSKEGVCW